MMLKGIIQRRDHLIKIEMMGLDNIILRGFESAKLKENK